MRIGTKILLLMLLLTIGSAGVVTWVVTLNVTRYEKLRVEDEVSLAIHRYQSQLDDHYRGISQLVQNELGNPAIRSALEAADDPENKLMRAQLKDQIFGKEMQGDLETFGGQPSFQILINAAHDVIFVASANNLVSEKLLTSSATKWPVDAVIDSNGKPVMQYLATPAGLFLAMGIPLQAELDQPPSHAYFAGFQVDNAWVRARLLADAQATDSTVPRLTAWFVVDGKVAARASASANESDLAEFTPPAAALSADPQRVQFEIKGEQFVGQSFNIDAQGASVRLILASSLDRALIPLHRLQRSILLTALGACAIAIVVCRLIAGMISKPISALVEGTQRIAAGQFDSPVHVLRGDELGELAASFNQMAQGLKQRDGLLEERVKIERDLAVARKIQMGVLPKTLPACAGYEMAVYSLPAEETGGDIYDLFTATVPVSANLSAPAPIVLLLADATGHGIGPALSVTQVRSMLRIGVRLGAPIQDVLQQINRQLCQDLGTDRFVAAFLGLLDPSTHTVHYQSAGQGPLLHYHAATGQFDWLESSMLPLGIDDQAPVESPLSMKLAPGDLVVLLTDGFYEFQNTARQLFGEERVATIIRENASRPPAELLTELLKATQAFADGAKQLDDMTAIIIRRAKE